MEVLDYEYFLLIVTNEHVDKLHHITKAFGRAVGQITISLELPRRMQPHKVRAFIEVFFYVDTIDDLITDSLEEIQEPLSEIPKSSFGETSWKFEVGGSKPPNTPPSSPLIAHHLPSLSPHNTFLITPWNITRASPQHPLLEQGVIVMSGGVHDLPRHSNKLFPKYDLDKKEPHEDYVKKF